MHQPQNEVACTKISPLSWLVSEGTQQGVHEDVKGVTVARGLVEAFLEASDRREQDKKQRQDLECAKNRKSQESIREVILAKVRNGPVEVVIRTTTCSIPAPVSVCRQMCEEFLHTKVDRHNQGCLNIPLLPEDLEAPIKWLAYVNH